MSQHVVTRTGPIRIGDAERDQAVAVLSEHFVAGRLTQDEFEERSNQATRARYADDLSPLFADLPESAASQPGPRTWSPGFRPGQQGFRPGPPPFLWLAAVLIVGLVVGTVTLAAPWILWVLFWIALFSGPYRHRRSHHPHRR
jgi:hypothetical protein